MFSIAKFEPNFYIWKWQQHSAEREPSARELSGQWSDIQLMSSAALTHNNNNKKFNLKEIKKTRFFSRKLFFSKEKVVKFRVEF